MSDFGALLNAGIEVDGPGGILTFLNPVRFNAGIQPLLGTGKVFYVDSGSGSDNNTGRSVAQAMATIDGAVGKCEANRGDFIYVMQGHAENIASATSLVCDIAGVTIIGLGTGSLRPKLTFTAAAGSIVVSAANVTFENIVFEAAFADVAEAFTPSAAYLTIQKCQFQAAAADQNFVEIVDTGTTDNQCDGLALIQNVIIEPDLLFTSILNIDADLDQLVFVGNYANLGVNTSDLPIVADVATTKDLTNCLVAYNTLIRLNDANPLLITADTTTANTGVLHHNYVRHLDVAGEALITAGTNVGQFENYVSAAVDASGWIIPARDT